MKLKTAFKIDGKEVIKFAEFLGYELYQHGAYGEGGGTVVTYFVRGGEVVGQTTTDFAGADAVVTFDEISNI